MVDGREQESGYRTRTLITVVVMAHVLAVAVILLAGRPTKPEPTPVLSLEEQLDELHASAARAIQEKDIDRANDLLCQYMALSESGETEHSVEDLFPLFVEMQLGATSFISGHYSDDFIRWFFTDPTCYWAEGPGRDLETPFELVSAKGEHYRATVWGFPFLEGWTVIGVGAPAGTAPVPLISGSRTPTLVLTPAGKGSVASTRSAELPDVYGPLQCVWPPEFHDLDADGQDEVWVRFNRTWADGFSQHLAVYRVTDASLSLVTNFSGLAEGIARRLPDGTIEVGKGYSEESPGHLGLDQHKIETLVYRNGAFEKIAERTVPHILWSDDWIDYYDLDAVARW